MKLYIKSMVCSRCKMVVKSELEKAGIETLSIELGEIETKNQLTKPQMERLNTNLKEFGFEMIDSKKSRVIEKIKNNLVTLIHSANSSIKVNLSDFISDKLHYDYNYLSNLFSEVEGTTIEKYYINLRIERVKELLVYDELSLSEIADKLGYSSIAYLSSQFKKVTGLTPSFYKSLKEHKRKNTEEL